MSRALTETSTDVYLRERLRVTERRLVRTGIVGSLCALALGLGGWLLVDALADPEAVVDALPRHLDRPVHRVLRERAIAAAPRSGRALASQLALVPRRLSGVLQLELALWSDASAVAINRVLPNLVERAAKADPDGFSAALDAWERDEVFEPMRAQFEVHLQPLIRAEILPGKPGAMRYLEASAELVSRLSLSEHPSPERALERQVLVWLASMVADEPEPADLTRP